MFSSLMIDPCSSATFVRKICTCTFINVNIYQTIVSMHDLQLVIEDWQYMYVSNATLPTDQTISRPLYKRFKPSISFITDNFELQVSNISSSGTNFKFTFKMVW